MDIFQKIHDLNLPEGSYVVVGSGVLVALGLLEWDDDVDIAVTPGLYENFRQQGWRQTDWEQYLAHADGRMEGAT